MEFKNTAIAITKVEEIQLMDAATPELGPNDVLVHVKATALCTQEQRYYKGVKKVNGFPCIAGHESAGEVVAVGSAVKSAKVGDKVVVAIRNNLPVINGTAVKNGEPKEPTKDGFWYMLGGTLQRYVVRHENSIFHVAEDAKYEEVCLTEPVACVMHSVKRGRVQIGEKVVIIGAGIMGLLHVQYAKKQGAIVIMSEVDPVRREKAKAYGADFCINPLERNVVQQVKDLTGGKGADVVFNTTAIHDAWVQAIDMLAHFGRLVCYSSQHPDLPVDVYMGKVHSNEIEIIGAVGSTPQEMYTATQLIASGVIDVKGVTDSYVPFENAKEAFVKATTPATYRVIITD